MRVRSMMAAAVLMASSPVGMGAGATPAAAPPRYSVIPLLSPMDLRDAGLRSVEPRSLNDAGQIATEVFPVRGVLWEKEQRTELGSLGGNHTYPRAINDRGEVVGSSDVSPEGRQVPGGRPAKHHAFRWREGVMRDLGTLGGDYSQAVALNAPGQIVGWATTTPGGSLSLSEDGFVAPGDLARHAFLVSGDHMYHLNALIPAQSGWKLLEACAINNRGAILGVGTFEGAKQPFIATPAR